jgi:hypothetical protein
MCPRGRRLGAICLLVITSVQYSESAVSQDLRIENVTGVSPDSAREIESAGISTSFDNVASASVSDLEMISRVSSTKAESALSDSA